MKEAYLSDKVSPPSLLRSNYGIDLAVAPSLPPSLCYALLLAGAACVAGELAASIIQMRTGHSDLDQATDTVVVYFKGKRCPFVCGWPMALIKKD